MKKIFLLLFFVIFSAKAQVLWYGNPDSSLTSVFYRFDPGSTSDNCSPANSTSVSTAGTEVDAVYGKVWKVNKPLMRKRGELARTVPFVPADGQTLYYGWRWKIQGTPDIANGIAVFQWKTDASTMTNTQNYPVNLGYGGGNLSMNLYGPCASGAWDSCSGSIDNRLISVWNKPVAEGDWVSIVVKLKLSRDKNVGEVELWFNGVQQTFTNTPAPNYSINLSADKKIAYHKTFDGNVTYPKWGAYNSTSCSYEVNAYYDEMRIGSDLESVIDPLGGLLATPNFINDTKSLKLYPNPVKENGILSVITKEENQTIKVFDLLGKLLLTQKSSFDSTTQVNLNGLKTGTYILKVGDESSKFLVE